LKAPKGKKKTKKKSEDVTKDSFGKKNLPKSKSPYFEGKKKS